MNIKHLSAFLGISFCALMSTSAFAHEQHSHRNGCEHSTAKEYGAHFEKRMAALRTALKLTATQETGWTDFAGKMKPAEMAKHEHQDWAKLNTPDRLDRMLDGMKLHEKSMEEHVAAVKTFYEILNADQKKTFDSNFTGQHHEGHHHWKHHHDHDGQDKK